MKALVYEGPESLSLKDVPRPVARGDEQLVNIASVGICGSDMHAWLGHDNRRPAPLVLGHEAAGIVEDGSQKGRRVAINPLVTCARCANCLAGRENICPERQIISMPPRAGAFAQFVSIPDENLITVPDDVPLAKAALCEPLAVSWHAARLALDALHPSMDRNAIIIGGGAIGVSAALALHAMGVDDVRIVEPNQNRREFLDGRSGLRVMPKAEGKASILVDAAGFTATRAIASERVAPGGVIVHVGLGEDEGGLDIRRLTLQEITFVGTYTYNAADFRDAAEAAFDGRLGPLDWFETRSLKEGPDAFRDIRDGKIASPKTILDPWA